MSTGQEQALSELRRLAATAPHLFQIDGEPLLESGVLLARIALRLDEIVTGEGGLDLRQREEFILLVPAGFPFDRPSIRVDHDRFAGFPHVTWRKWLCLYQSEVEWNPSDGLFGFFDRLVRWLKQAAINEMDPIEGPLEPPHHVTDFSQVPVVVRCNSPCAPGDFWMGLAQLTKHPNRMELIGWTEATSEWPTATDIAVAVFLRDALPMEFPRKGADFFALLQAQGIERAPLIRLLAFAAKLTKPGEPIHLVIGLPMRRGPDGTNRHHIAVWTTDASFGDSLRLTLPTDFDDAELTVLREELSANIAGLFEAREIHWCQVLEDRSEIVVRRDSATTLAWLCGKRVLILGCGALGSWSAEMVVRAGANSVHLVDKGIVKPGLLARQNFTLNDIGAKKALALAGRLMGIAHNVSVTAEDSEAYDYVMRNQAGLAEFDLVFDCTASWIFQSKLERSWYTLDSGTPPIIATVIDGNARHALSVVVPRNARRGIVDAFLNLKVSICRKKDTELVEAFYSERASRITFQPEPGCSDPTFSGSMSDVISLCSASIEAGVRQLSANSAVPLSFAVSRPVNGTATPALRVFQIPTFHDLKAGNYTVRMSASIFDKAKRWIHKNNALRAERYETGGLLWGYLDDALKILWIFDLTGPPPDSQHTPTLFTCGVKGTRAEHFRRFNHSYGTVGFVGHWHTHPKLPSTQSRKDIATMAALVSWAGLKQRRSVMLIFGRARSRETLGVYLYDSAELAGNTELIKVGVAQMVVP